MSPFWFLVLSLLLSVTCIESEEKATHINGENGWYLPLADGSLKWMNMETIERIKSYNDDISFSINPVKFDLEVSNNDTQHGFSISDIFNPVKFWLYSALSPDTAEQISTEAKGFNPEHPTVFVSHGFLQGKSSLNINRSLRKAFFSRGNYNFIYIEWMRAVTVDYIAASHAVPGVGKKVARLFDFLVTNYDMNCTNTRFIGHSLGAHVVGIAAKNVQSCKVPHIIALDPALPLFPYFDTHNRLNSTDAEYVESIQTDGGFYGHVRPVGSATFYCNGGKIQPGCGGINVCNHERSVAYLTEAIEKNDFPSTKCDHYRSAINNNCGNKYSEINMGNDRNKLLANGVYFVKTNSKVPFGVLDM